MTNNDQILNNLIGNQQNKNISPNAVPTGTDDEVLITTARVVSTRYKIYLIGLAVLIFILGYSFLSPLYDEIQGKNSEISDLDMQIQNLEMKQRQYETNRQLVDEIMEVDSGIVKCLNDGEDCNALPDALKINDNFSIARSYILLGDMEDKKMEVNEKKIIKNIDSFLLKNMWTDENEDADALLRGNKNLDEGNVGDEGEGDTNDEGDVDDGAEGDENNVGEGDAENIVEGEINDESEGDIQAQREALLAQFEQEDLTQRSSSASLLNGKINKVIIGDKQRFNDTLYYVPIELSITFDDKDGLLSFIDNVEKRVPEDKDMRLLYKISKITYDIVNYDEPQETTINMYLYYYEK